MKSLRFLGIVAVVLVAALGVWGCGGGDSNESGSGGDAQLIVSAAASLQDSFTAYGVDFEEAEGVPVQFSFAGSDELAAQIRQGVTPDVYAAANTTLPEELHGEGLVAQPEIFTANRLVIAVPADSGIESVEDLAEAGVTLAIGSPTVPIGDYTRKVLSGLPDDRQDAILANVRTEEPNVSGIIGKLTQGAVDAGFTYVTDVASTDGELVAIELPEDLQPGVAYGVAVVEGAGQGDLAQTFIDGLISGAGADALAAAGFEPAP